MSYKKLFLSCCCACLSMVSPAQTISENIDATEGYTGPADKITVVRLDPFTRIPIGDVPFDRTIVLRMYFSDTFSIPSRFYLYERDTVLITPLATGRLPKGTSLYDDKWLSTFYAVDIYVPPLNPGSRYQLYNVIKKSRKVMEQNYEMFKLIRDGREAEVRSAWRNELRENTFAPEYEALATYYRLHGIGALLQIRPEDTAKARILALQNTIDTVTYTDDQGQSDRISITTYGKSNTKLASIQGKVETTAPLNLVADAGVVFAGFQRGFTTLVPYVGLALSLRAFDSDIPFRTIVPRLKWYQRLTINAGITVNSIAKENHRANLFGSNNLMAGVGYKFSHVVCVTGGLLFYNNVDPNPILEKKTLGVAPYLGLSINLKIRSALGAVANLFTYGK